MGAGRLADAAELLTRLGLPSPVPILYICEALGFLCKAHESEKTGPAPKAPSPEWVLEQVDSLMKEPEYQDRIATDEEFERTFGGLAIDGVSL